jgi:hypothetical protein
MAENTNVIIWLTENHGNTKLAIGILVEHWTIVGTKNCRIGIHDANESLLWGVDKFQKIFNQADQE